MNKLQERRGIVDTRLRQYYADVVAQALRSSAVTAGLADRLAAGQVDPVGVVREFRLPENVFLQQLQERLRAITDDAAFSVALTLLLRGGFDEAVWAWFSGGEPSEVLRERGITTSLMGSETKALEAMAVFALLIGHGTNRFVVVIDELDQLITAAGRRADAIEAFKELLRVFAKSGTFLVLAGLPDLLDVLRRDVVDRFGTPVRMWKLTTADALEYVRARQGGGLAPFDEETVRFVVDTVDGSPRGVVTLLFHLWRRASGTGKPVTPTMVHEVARTIYDVADGERASSDIIQVLRGHGWEFIPDFQVGDTPESRVDFWVFMGGQESGCAILLTESLFTDADVDRLVERAQLVERLHQCEVVLVVLGRQLPERYQRRLTEAYHREPLRYDRRSFVDRFLVELKSIAANLSVPVDDQLPGALQQYLERFSRHQTRTQHTLAQLTGQVERALGELARIRSAPVRGTEPAGLPTSTADGQPGPAGLPAALPAPVAELFTDALTSVDIAAPMETVLRAAFDLSAATDNVRMVVRAGLPTDGVQLGAGVAALLTILVRAFGDAVAGWYRALGDDGTLSFAERENIVTLGQVFDAAYENLSVYRLDPVAELIGQARQAGVPGITAPRPPQVQDTLGGFGGRVGRTVLAGFNGGDR